MPAINVQIVIDAPSRERVHSQVYSFMGSAVNWAMIMPDGKGGGLEAINLQERVLVSVPPSARKHRPAMVAA
jgi:hypothetical protein